MDKNLPIVAIVGPPNVGKSTLLNKIKGDRLAITADLPGTTRDRQYLDTSWNGVSFTLVDTAGLTMDPSKELEINISQQVEVALKEAAVIILVADGKEEASSIKQSLLLKFRKSKKPIILAINKVDSPNKVEEKNLAFKKLGIKDSFAISSVTGRGFGDLLDTVAQELKKIPAAASQTVEDEESIHVAIVGKPNVGKSSIFNKILKEDRVVVSKIPGTTRTAIDSKIKINGTHYTFIDTAGLKKKAHRQTEADTFSGFQSFKSIRRSDVCFFVIDALEPITKQDLKIAGEIKYQNKGVIILANKIDEYHGEKEKLKDYVSHYFPYLWSSPLFLVSAETGEGLEEAINAIKPIFNARLKKIDEETLSAFLNHKLKTSPPQRLRDQKAPKVFGLRQRDVNPPTFELLVNHPGAISQQFRNFLEKSIIKELGFWGTSIVLKLKGKK